MFKNKKLNIALIAGSVVLFIAAFFMGRAESFTGNEQFLKRTKFNPRAAGQLGFYVALVDDKVRIPSKHEPTVGILLVAGKNDAVVHYALASTRQPLAVSRYDLAEDAQAALPDEATIARGWPSPELL